MELPVLSVVVCTYGRPGLAIACMTALARLCAGRPEVEMIVVHNGDSTDDLQALREGLAATSARVLHEPHVGLSYARNRGIRAAAGDWLAYLDDDAVPASDWVDCALQYLASPPRGVALVAGASFPEWPERRDQNAVDPRHIGVRWRDLLSILECESHPGGGDLPMIVGCNMIVNAKLLKDIGGFPVKLGRTPTRLLGGEEIHVARELHKRGHTVVFESRLKVFHKIHPERLTLSWIRRRASAEGALRWIVNQSLKDLAKAIASVPILYLAFTFSTRLRRGEVVSFDGYVRRWHNVGLIMACWSMVVSRLGGAYWTKRRQV